MKLEMLVILIITSIACTSVGNFLVLRKMSMITDAISHTILLGIIIAFFITKSLTSPLLFTFAALFGLITVVSVELLVKTKKIKEDAAVGIIFPLFFAIAILLITSFADKIHIDKDTVLLGQIALAPLNRITVFGYSIPYSMVVMSIVAIANIIYISLFFKELKITTFDKEYATLTGFNYNVVNYSLMTLVSITAVSSFDVVGAILVISLMIVPAASAYLLTKKLHDMILLSIVFGIISVVIGLEIGYVLDLSIMGIISVVNGCIFMLVVLFSPKNGIISKVSLRKYNKEKFEENLLLMHISNHPLNIEELGKNTIEQHINWNRKKIEKIILKLTKNEYIYCNDKMYHLTTKGSKFVEELKNKYFD